MLGRSPNTGAGDPIRIPQLFSLPPGSQQDNGVQLASNQVQYSLLYREPERNGVAEACRAAGATLIAYSPLCQGLLTGERTPLHPNPAPLESGRQARPHSPGAWQSRP